MFVAVLGHLAMTRAAIDSAGERLLGVSTDLAADIDSRIRELVRSAGQLCTQSSSFLESVAAVSGSARPDGSAAARSIERVTRLWAADSTRMTREILNSGVSRELTRAQAEMPVLYERMIVTDLDGIILGATEAVACPVVDPYKHRPEIPGRSAKPRSELNYVEEHDALEVVVPIPGADKTAPIAVFRGYSSMMDIAQSIEDTEVGVTGFSLLLSNTGRVLAAPLSAPIVSDTVSSGRAAHLDVQFPVWYRGTGTGTKHGSVVALAPVSSTPTAGPSSLAGMAWIVSTEQREAEVLAVPSQFSRTAFIVVLLTGALVMIVGLFLSDRIVEPLRRLRDGAKRIAAGNLDLELKLTTGDEIEELAHEFTAMAEKLSRSYRGLEDKVRQATSELAHKNESLEATLAAMAEGLMVLSSDHRILLWNHAAEVITGYAADQAIGRNCEELLKPVSERGKKVSDEVCPIDMLAGLDQSWEHLNLEAEITTRDGSHLPVSITSSLLAGSQTKGCVVVLRDISKEKELDRIKSDMISMVSHELRTPLGPLIGFAELLQDTDLPEDKRRRYLNIIIEQGRRLSGLVDNFLTLSQLEAGKFELDLQETDLHSICLEVIAIETSHNPKHDLVNDIQRDFPRIRADAHRIKRVIHNLVSNAIKYSPNGGTIRIWGKDLGSAIEVSVTDQGVGIREKDLHKLFERFSRVHRDSLPDVTGTGLGLSICKTIVEEHGGSIRVDSEYGNGSTFTIQLPKSGPKPAA